MFEACGWRLGEIWGGACVAGGKKCMSGERCFMFLPDGWRKGWMVRNRMRCSRFGLAKCAQVGGEAAWLCDSQEAVLCRDC